MYPKTERKIISTEPMDSSFKPDPIPLCPVLRGFFPYCKPQFKR